MPFNKLIILASLLTCLPAFAAPNFIFILTDDQGWCDISRPADPLILNSTHAHFHTPNMVRLSEMAMNFSSGYSPASVCTPSRRSIQFGVTPARGGADFKTDFDPEGKLSLPQMIKKCDASYTCAHFGKWGEYMIGSKGRYDSDPRGEPKALGYDVSDGFTGNEHGFAKGNNMVKMNVENDDPKRIYSLTARGIDFMKRQAEKGAPFYLQLSHYAIHRAAQAKHATIDKYKGKGDKRGGEFTQTLPPMIEELDNGIGQLLDAVRDLGLESNTYIIYGSDNGGALSVRVEPDQEGLPNRNAPLSQGKHYIREGGLRIPFMIAGPGIAKDSWCREPVVLTDLYATIHAILGAPFPLGEHVDSASILPLLQNEGQGSIERKTPGIVFHDPFKVHPQSASRRGDFKVFIKWKPESWAIQSVELYDVSKDIGEKTDLAEAMPNRAKAMSITLKNYLKAVATSPPGRRKWETTEEEK